MSDMLGLNMRPIFVSVCLFLAALASGQTAQPTGQTTAPNAVKLTKYILGVADLDKSYAFYHALGLDLQNNAAALPKPNALAEMLLRLVDVPLGTKFRNMMLKIPNAAFPLEVTEFTNMDVHPAMPRIQDPGASLLVLDVDDIDAALAAAKKAGGEVVSTGGKPVKRASGPGRVVTVKDPDGYYVELAQTTATASGAPSGTGKVIGAGFGSMVVQNAEKAAAFYRDHFGFAAKTNAWTSKFDANLGTPGAQIQTAEVTVPGTTLSWRFMEFKGVNRKPYTPRIPDPGAAGLGLQVHDMDAAIAAVKAAGGSSITQGGNIKMGKGKVGFVRDPNGILLELAQP